LRPQPIDADKPNQKLTLSKTPAMQHHFSEQKAVDERTARLRALRLAKEASSEPAEPKPTKPARARKKTMRRGIGST